ncbi:MAG: aminotransferase class V-fold PLP-dependent enzyme, partial [Planctomycetia bacterium]|nr:aminotransferase class V-fold PLP-dependent enzyme [Planctomycetia bacterium]
MIQNASDKPRIYLDNAATSWPKPESVYSAVDNYLRNLGAPAGRSGYAEAIGVSQAVETTRRQIAGMLGLADPTHLIFTANGTDSLNLVIHGLLGRGDHVITSVVEHNSVLRPLRELEDAGQITVTRVGCGSSGVVDPQDVRAAIRPSTRLVALCHASNVTGAVQPIAEVGRIAREAGVLVLCDAAQTVGHMPLDMRSLHVDFLAASGHKGLLGPLGTGVLAIRPDAAHRLRSVRQGGTGTQSDETRQPDDLPAKFESGNLNVPGILGLGAAAGFLSQRGLSTIHDEGTALTARLLDGFRGVIGLRVRGPSTAVQRVPLVSITLEGYDPQEIALSLDAVYRIQVRPGLHCAPAMHQTLGTHKTG